MIVFYTDPFTGEAMYRKKGEDVVRELSDKDDEIIQKLLQTSKNFYPEQFAALNEVYAKSSPNKRHYDFLRARRMANCCFGDNQPPPDIDEFGVCHFKFVKCPLMAECKHHKIICQPKFNSSLTERELQVMELYFRHVSTDKIADRLFLSIHTVRNHRRNSLKKTKLHSLEEFQDYAHRNKLFK